MKIAFLGGTFDPIHVGHIWIAQQVCEAYNLDKVFIVPNYGKSSAKWNKDVVASNTQRLEMCRLAVRGFKQLEVCSIEIEKRFQYTYQTVLFLKSTFKLDKVSWIVGSDWVSKLDTFQRTDILHDNCFFIVIDRIGADAITSIVQIPKVRFGLSSTYIKERIRDGKPITGLVPRSVEMFIKKENLYVSRRRR